MPPPSNATNQVVVARFTNKTHGKLANGTWIYLFSKQQGKTAYSLQHELSTDTHGYLTPVNLLTGSGKDVRPLTSSRMEDVNLTSVLAKKNVTWKAFVARQQLAWSELEEIRGELDTKGQAILPFVTPPKELLSVKLVPLEIPAAKCAIENVTVFEDWQSTMSHFVATDPNKTQHMVILPKPSKSYQLKFGSELLDTFKEGPLTDLDKALEVFEKFEKKSPNRHSALHKWQEEQKEKAKEAYEKAEAVWEVYGMLARATKTDTVPVAIETDHVHCGHGLERHPVTVNLAGAGAIAPQGSAKRWKLKARPPEANGNWGANLKPNVYTITCPSCDTQRQITSKVHVLPNFQAVVGVKYIPKVFNQAAKGAAFKFLNTVLSPSVQLELEIGALVGEAYFGWQKVDDDTVAFIKQFTVGAKPLIEASLQFKLSFVSIGTGCPPSILEYIGDVGVYLKVGAAVEASISYTNSKKYLPETTKLSHEANHIIKGGISGNLYFEFGVYAKIGPKDIAEVAITMGFRVGVTFPMELEIAVKEEINGKIGAELDPVTFKIAIKTKFMWVFSYNKAKEWVIRKDKTILVDNPKPKPLYKWPEAAHP